MKVLKLIVCAISVVMIVICLLHLVGVISFPLSRVGLSDNVSQGKAIGSWSSEKIGTDEYVFSITIYDNETVNIDIGNHKYSTNSFFPVKELEACNYKSKMIFWGMQYSEKDDIYASVVPRDCKGVQIDGEIYESQMICIATNTGEYFVNIVIASVKHTDIHELFLIDEQGTSHNRPLL